MPIRSFQHLALSVPDAAVGRDFYTAFGLEAVDRGNHVAMRCKGRDQDQVVLIEGSKKKELSHISLGTNAAELKEIQQRLEGAGVALLDPPSNVEGDGIWFRDPDGQLLNVKVAEAAPWRTDPEWLINTPGHTKRLNARGCPPRDLPVEPRRLGHMIMFTPNVDRKLDFYITMLGMRLSDRSGDFIAFMHHEPPSDHHVIALLKDDKPGLHHASFEVGTPDEISIGAQRLMEKGYRDGWGFGRHVIGSNFFHYLRDPWGSLVEYFCDIDYIPEGATWDARDWPLEDSFYIWGPNPPSDFGINFDAVDA